MFLGTITCNTWWKKDRLNSFLREMIPQNFSVFSFDNSMFFAQCSDAVDDYCVYSIKPNITEGKVRFYQKKYWDVGKCKNILTPLPETKKRILRPFSINSPDFSPWHIYLISWWYLVSLRIEHSHTSTLFKGSSLFLKMSSKTTKDIEIKYKRWPAWTTTGFVLRKGKVNISKKQKKSTLDKTRKGKVCKYFSESKKSIDFGEEKSTSDKTVFQWQSGEAKPRRRIQRHLSLHWNRVKVGLETLKLLGSYHKVNDDFDKGASDCVQSFLTCPLWWHPFLAHDILFLPSSSKSLLAQ